MKVIRHVARIIVAITAVASLVGCAASLQGRVSQFHTLDARARTFTVVPVPTQSDSLEFKTYSAMLISQLAARGWKEVDFETAEVGVFLQYGVSRGREVAFSYPVFGQVPTGNSTTTGSINRSGNFSTFNATTTAQTTTAVVGTGVGSTTVFDRSVQVDMYDMQDYRRTQRMTRIYESRVHSSGSNGELAVVMPTLLRAAFEDFPGRSGSTRNFSAEIKQ